MTKSQMIAKLARQTSLPIKQVEMVLDCFVENITETLSAGDKVTIAGFGRFEMRPRKAKHYTNPKTKDSSVLDPTDIPGFKASGLFKEKVAGKTKD